MKRLSKDASKFFTKPTTPMSIDPKASVDDFVRGLDGLSFQARNVSQAVSIWEGMLGGKNIIFLGLAGAMVPAGLRRVISYLIEKRFIDCLVSTGANLFHDCHESLGMFHWKGSQHADDLELKDHDVDRIYDVFASEKEFRQTDDFIEKFCAGLDTGRAYGTREFLYLLGRALCEKGKGSGILTAACKAGVPVYCPAVADSSIGIAAAAGRQKGSSRVQFDVIKDVVETSEIASLVDTGVIYVGGGVPKNFIQQTEVTGSVLGGSPAGHRYAIQVITDPPHWGGLSGCTFEEAQSWGKISGGANKVSVYCDATIALPLIVTALAARAGKPGRKTFPAFSCDEKLEISFT
ncbi:MAG: deoxyhypusine synthase family protein [Candidatus Eisenbacteria bacterium]|nr:deoxyhypusine synthase family protein [Candidatus Eisenbacteria bacterium]